MKKRTITLLVLFVVLVILSATTFIKSNASKNFSILKAEINEKNTEKKEDLNKVHVYTNDLSENEDTSSEPIQIVATAAPEVITEETTEENTEETTEEDSLEVSDEVSETEDNSSIDTNTSSEETNSTYDTNTYENNTYDDNSNNYWSDNNSSSNNTNNNSYSQDYNSSYSDTSTSNNSYGCTNLEYEVFQMINAYRVQNNLPAVSWSNEVYQAAAIRAKEIPVNLSHTRPSGGDVFDMSDAVRSENLAYGYYTAAEVFDAWVNSSGHRQNILDPVAKTGAVALYKTNSEYQYYWINLFGY